MRTDGRTDMTKLTVAFGNFANATKNEFIIVRKQLVNIFSICHNFIYRGKHGQPYVRVIIRTMVRP
jgi:hypothetical protein